MATENSAATLPEVPANNATLGEIAEILKSLKAQGTTYQSIQYALERVYWEEMSKDEESLRRLRALALNS